MGLDSANRASELQWEHLNEVIERAARMASGMGYEDRREFANEVASIAREKVVVASSRIAEAEQPDAFVGKIVWNTAIDFGRAEGRRRKREVSNDDPQHAAAEPPARSLSPEQSLLRSESDAQVRAWFRELGAENPCYARVLWMRDVQEMAAAEIGAIENKREDNINQIVVRARRKMRQVLERYACVIRGQPRRQEGGRSRPIDLHVMNRRRLKLGGLLRPQDLRLCVRLVADWSLRAVAGGQVSARPTS